MREDPLETSQAGRLRALVDIARMVNDGVSRWERVAEAAVRATALVADAATVWAQPGGTSTLLCIAATRHDPAMAPPRAETSPDPYGRDGLIEAVLESGTPAVLDAEDVPGYVDSLSVMLGPWADGGRVGGAVILPMYSKGLTRGVLCVGRGAGSAAFTAAQIDFLEALAEITAVTLGTCQTLQSSALAVEEMRQQIELVDRISDVVVAWDTDCQIITWNAAAEKVFGYPAAEALGCDAHVLLNTRFIGPGDEVRTYAELIPALREAGIWRGEAKQRRNDGAEVELLCSLTVLFDDLDASLPSAVSISQDVTKQRGEERLALNDALTGLPNRRYLLRYLADVIARPQSGEVLAVLFLDLDGFKNVNDTRGHGAGDEVLRVIADRLTDELRRDDIVGRLGGDEFVAVCRCVTDRVEAMKVAHRLIAAASKPIPIGTDHVRVVPSVGIVVLGEKPGHEESDLSPTDILRRADTAMYTAKRNGRGPIIAD